MPSLATPLDHDVRDRELVYVSQAKLEQLLLNPANSGFGGGVAGFALQKESRPRGPRELLTAAAKLFEQQGLLTYENSAREGSWLLVRAIMACGTAWPWARGESRAAEQTAWWVGRSESTRILAYGHRDHLLGQGKMPSPEDTEDTPTWWP